jgi:hypothetical protein
VIGFVKSRAVRRPHPENTVLLAADLYNAATVEVPLPGASHSKENTMKRAVRMLILMVGLACTYVAIATPILNAALGPIPLCNPANPNCKK